MKPDKLKALVLEETKNLSNKRKPRNGEEALDQFLDAMMNVIAPYLPEYPNPAHWGK